MTRVAPRLLGVLLALLALACSAGSEHVAPTQITLRIFAAPEVRERMAQLRVRSYREEVGRYRWRAERSYDKAKLAEVVDLVLAPLPGGLEGGLLVVVDAIDARGVVLVQARATVEFLRAEQRLIELWLYRCGLLELGELCSDPNCEGAACQTCVDARCAPTPVYDPRDLDAFDDTVTAAPKPPPWHDAGMDAEIAPEACAQQGCLPPDDSGQEPPDTSLSDAQPEDGTTGTPDAGFDAGADAGLDAGPSDGGSDGGFDGGFDGGRDGGDDAGVDAGRDAGFDGGRDAGSEAGLDAGDAGSDAGDGGAPDTGPALEPVGRCAQGVAWTTVAYAGAIPPLARVLAGHTSSDRGSLPQYICRVRTADGNLTPAKVSQDPANAARFDFGCFAAYLSGGAWVEYANFDASSRFEVLTPPSICVLDWITVPVGGALPARALPIGSTGAGAPLYSCRIPINITSGGVTRMGTHMGRVSASAGDLCRVQYYGGVEQQSTFEVLVQSSP
jgi:hypothetical protein